MSSFDLLSPVDAQLWYWDTPQTPMNMGNICLFERDGLVDASGAFRLDEVRDSIASRLHLVPRYRRKIFETPGNFLHPVLVDDPDFDIANHVELISLPEPGTLDQLKAAFAGVHEGMLDRSRPLWKIVFVEGLDDGRIGMVQKIHHTPFDGATTVRIMRSLFDEEREPPQREPAPPWQPQPPPSYPEIMAAAAGQQLETAWRLAAEGAAAAPFDSAAAMDSAQTLAAIGSFGPAPPTSLNKPVGPRRRFDWISTTLADVKRIRGLVSGSKLNDVMLACVAGGLRALFQSRGEDVTAFWPRVMVPVDTRGAEEQVGNQVSAMVIDLPIGEPDPVTRLKLIAAEMAALKAGKQSAGMKLLTDLSSFTPPALLAMSGAGSAGPGGFMNLTVTNVPGPPRELFLLGARMLELNPMLPIGNQLTLNVAVESYVDKLSIGVCCDPEAVPDSDVVTAGIESSLGALLERAAAPAPS